MKGKIKSLHGVYKALGRDAFLCAAHVYSDKVQKTVDGTLNQMESSWYDAKHTITEADKMVSDYNKGILTVESANKMLKCQQLHEKFYSELNSALKNMHPVRLITSLQSPNMSYAGELLRKMHNAFEKTYGKDCLTDKDYEFINIPAVIRSRNTGKMCLGVVTLDLESSGEHWGTDFITPFGVVSQGDPNMSNEIHEYLCKNFIPYDYWYTADVERDCHVDFNDVPDDVAKLIAIARGEQEPSEFEYLHM